MKENLHYISSFCRIIGLEIIRNGNSLLISKGGYQFLKDAYETLDNLYPKFYKMDALSKLGIIATHVLLKDFDLSGIHGEEVGIVLSNTNASIEADVNYYEASKNFPSPALFVYTLPNIVIGEISIRYKFKGENGFFVSDTFDAKFLEFYVNDLMQNRNIKTCICGWLDVVNDSYDACLFLVQQQPNENSFTFNEQNLIKIYNQYGKE